MHLRKENGDRNTREAAPGDGVTREGTGLVQRRYREVEDLETCMLLLSLTPTLQRLVCEDVAKMVGHQQMKDDYAERDKTQIVGSFECE